MQGKTSRGELGGIGVGGGYPVRVSAVINVSPESFYKNSVRTDPERIAKTAMEAVEEGADILDIGGMSTAPYLDTRISAQEERSRVVRAIEAASDVVGFPISVDTQRSDVARAAVDAGASIVNDISGLRTDPSMAETVSELGASLILTASASSPIAGTSVGRVIRSLRESLDICESSGIDTRKVVVDPGIGFFRDQEKPWFLRDMEILRSLRQLDELRRPIHLGLSRKSFIGEVLHQQDPSHRLHGSLVATGIAVYNGADIIRTHDVAETVDVVRLSERIAGRV